MVDTRDCLRKLPQFGGIILGLILVACAGCFGQCHFSDRSPGAITYTFDPVVSDQSLSFRITIEFRGASSGRTKLWLPSEWAGQQHDERAVTELQALSPRTFIDDAKSPAERLLRFPPNSQVRLSYVLVKDWKGKLDSSTRFRVDLSPLYFHFVGTTALVRPQINPYRTVDVHFDWQKLPASWTLATSVATDDRCQSFHGYWRDALNSLFVGGDYRIHHTTINGNPLNFAIRGQWQFTDENWVDHARKIVDFERTFWRDDNFPYFLITLTPLDQDHGSSGGTALTNAFMQHLSRLDTLTSTTLGILAHETFHEWNPYRIGLPKGAEYSVSWFFEGFTRYYQNVMLLRAGLMDFPGYVSSVNELLQKYQLTEGTHVTLEDFIRRHSANHAVLDQLDQRRGAVIALWLDATIRRRSRNQASLDNVMFDLAAQEAARRRAHKAEPVALTNKRLFQTIGQRISQKSLDQLRRYVEQGGVVPIPENALGPCVQSDGQTMTRFDLGFDGSRLSSGDTVVAGVVPYTEAYRAGLRDGQELMGWSIHNGDTSKEVRLKIKEPDGERTITYFPRGAKVTVQQFQLDSDKYTHDPRACQAMN